MQWESPFPNQQNQCGGPSSEWTVFSCLALNAFAASIRIGPKYQQIARYSWCCSPQRPANPNNNVDVYHSSLGLLTSTPPSTASLSSSSSSLTTSSSISACSPSSSSTSLLLFRPFIFLVCSSLKSCLPR